MKFQTILLAALAALFTACSVDENPVEEIAIQQRAISYSTGTRVSPTGFENGDQFAVWANYINKGVTTQYFEHQLVTLNDGLWTADPVHYWPAAGSLEFYAISPDPALRGHKNTIEIENGIEPTLKYHIADFSDEVDLIVASTEAYDCATPTLIPLHFKHVLGKMHFLVTNNCQYGIGLDALVDALTVEIELHTNGQLDWERRHIEPYGPKTTFTHTFPPTRIKAFDQAVVGTFYFIPEMIEDVDITATWTTLVGDVEANHYRVEKKIVTNRMPDAGSVTTINLVLSLDNSGTQGGDVNID